MFGLFHVENKMVAPNVINCNITVDWCMFSSWVTDDILVLLLYVFSSLVGFGVRKSLSSTDCNSFGIWPSKRFVLFLGFLEHLVSSILTSVWNNWQRLPSQGACAALIRCWSIEYIFHHFLRLMHVQWFSFCYEDPLNRSCLLGNRRRCRYGLVSFFGRFTLAVLEAGVFALTRHSFLLILRNDVTSCIGWGSIYIPIWIATHFYGFSSNFCKMSPSPNS